MKVTIVGAGNVGATAADVIASKGIADQVVLLDIKEGFAEGKALDLMQTATTKGFESITMIGSLLYLRILVETSLTIFALIPISSSRVIPGFRGIPDVITTTSLSLVRE